MLLCVLGSILLTTGISKPYNLHSSSYDDGTACCGPAVLIDGDVSTNFWNSAPGSPSSPPWVVFEFTDLVRLYQFQLWNNGDTTHDVKTFELHFSNDVSSSWTVLGQWVAATGTGWQNFSILLTPQPKAYKYWRLWLIDAHTASQPRPREIIFHYVFPEYILHSWSSGTPSTGNRAIGALIDGLYPSGLWNSYTSGTPPSPRWVILEFIAPVQLTDTFNFWNAGDTTHDVKKFEWHYSNDSAGPWSVLSQWTAAAGLSEWQYFNISVTQLNYYKYWRWWLINSYTSWQCWPKEIWLNYVFVTATRTPTTFETTPTPTQTPTTATPTTFAPTTINPTSGPTKYPTNGPTIDPTNTPSNLPTNIPTDSPSNTPSNIPTNNPTNTPSNLPTKLTFTPTDKPSIEVMIPDPTYQTTVTTSDGESGESVIASTKYMEQTDYEQIDKRNNSNSDIMIGAMIGGFSFLFCIIIILVFVVVKLMKTKQNGSLFASDAHANIQMKEMDSTYVPPQVPQHVISNNYNYNSEGNGDGTLTVLLPPIIPDVKDMYVGFVNDEFIASDDSESDEINTKPGETAGYQDNFNAQLINDINTIK